MEILLNKNLVAFAKGSSIRMLKKTFSANHTKSLVLSYKDDMRRAMKIAVMTTHTHCRVAMNYSLSVL